MRRPRCRLRLPPMHKMLPPSPATQVHPLSPYLSCVTQCWKHYRNFVDDRSKSIQAEIQTFLSDQCGVAISCIALALSPCCDAGKSLLSVSHIAANPCNAAKPLRSKTEIGAAAALVHPLLLLPVFAIPIHHAESKQSCSHVMWQATQAAVGPVEVSGVAS